MTSEVEELEVLLAAQRLAFLTSPLTIDSPNKLRQAIAAFCEALKSQATFVASPSPAEIGVPKVSDVLAQTGEFTSATPIICSCSDRIDQASQLAKQIDRVNTEVQQKIREGSDQVRELVQSVADLKTEVQNLCSAVLAPEDVTSSDDPPPVPNNDPHEVYPSEAPVDPSPIQQLWRLYSSLNFSPAVSASPPCPTQVSASVHTSNTLLPNPSCLPIRSSLAPVNAVETAPPEAKCPKSSSSEMKLEDCTCQTISGLNGDICGPGRMACKICALDEGPHVQADDMEKPPVHGWESSAASEALQKVPRIATAVEYFFTYNKGELEIEKGDKIVILQSPDTPAGWMYGEIVKKRRGMFPARYIGELPCPDVQTNLKIGRSLGDSGLIGPSPESPRIVTALYHFPTKKPGEIGLRRGDRVTILDSSDAPVGWMCGEVADVRRGIFPARYVKLEEDVSPDKTS